MAERTAGERAGNVLRRQVPGASTIASLESDIADEIRAAVAAETEKHIRLAQNVYGDEVQALAGDEPGTVGYKIAAAIRRGEGE